VTGSVVVRNTTETLSASWYNYSEVDCAVTLNQSDSGVDAANDTDYQISYTCYGDLYENNTAIRTMYDLAPVGLSTLIVFAVLGGALAIIAAR